MNKTYKQLSVRIRKKRARCAVIGMGYVGLPLAIAFAKNGFKVTGIDVDKDRLDRIQKKQSYISDITNKELRQVIDSGRFFVSDDFKILKHVDIVFICVPTPLKKKYYPDISYIKQAVRLVSRNIKRGSLIILESTTYPGTTKEIILPMMSRKGWRQGTDFYLCFSPERIDPGNKFFNLVKIPKVVGGLDKQATKLAELTYKNIISKVVMVSSARVAETVKLLENTFRIVNIGLIDEIAMMAYKMDIDIWEVIGAAKSKPFGFMPFYPGPGVGGHCIPKDPLYLYWKAKKFGFNSRFIKLASETISNMPKYIIKRVDQILNKRGVGLNKAKILIMGVTYKKDVKDLRKSPALDIIDILRRKNTSVFYHDPLIPYLKLHSINLESVDLNAKNLKKFDCVIVATDHSQIDYRFLLKNARLIFDTRNVYAKTKSRKVVKL